MMEVIKTPSEKFWTDAEVKALLSSKDIHQALELVPTRTEHAIRGKLKSLGITKFKARQWTESDVDFLRANADKTSYWIAKKLGKSLSSVCSKRRGLSLHRYFKCNVCGAPIQKGASFCTEHVRFGKQLRYYKNRVKNFGGDLSAEDIFRILSEDCWYCGKPRAEGIDRIDSSLGYYQENSRACCGICNTIKMALPEDVFLAHVKKISERHND